MGYYMRFFVEGPSIPSEDDIARHYSQNVFNCRLIDNEIKKESETYGVIEINHPKDGMFDEEIDEFREFVNDAEDGIGKQRVMRCLGNARATVAVQVLFGGRPDEDTFACIDPLWKYLFSKFEGLMQADGEGFYDSSGLILEVK